MSLNICHTVVQDVPLGTPAADDSSDEEEQQEALQASVDSLAKQFFESDEGVAFSMCEIVSVKEMKDMGTDNRNKKGLADENLYIAHLFEMEDGNTGARDWFTGKVNTKAKPAKLHFWVKFVDGEVKTFSKSYAKDWIAIREKCESA